MKNNDELTPQEIARGIQALLIIFVLMCVVGTMDYNDAKARAEHVAELRSK